MGQTSKINTQQGNAATQDAGTNTADKILASTDIPQNQKVDAMMVAKMEIVEAEQQRLETMLGDTNTVVNDIRTESANANTAAQKANADLTAYKAKTDADTTAFKNQYQTDKKDITDQCKIRVIKCYKYTKDNVKDLKTQRLNDIFYDEMKEKGIPEAQLTSYTSMLEAVAKGDKVAENFNGTVSLYSVAADGTRTKVTGSDMLANMGNTMDIVMVIDGDAQASKSKAIIYELDNKEKFMDCSDIEAGKIKYDDATKKTEIDLGKIYVPSRRINPKKVYVGYIKNK